MPSPNIPSLDLSHFSFQLFQLFGKKWRTGRGLYELFPPDEHLSDFISFSPVPLYKNKTFLHQKYVIEGLSIAQISSQIFSSKEAVRTNLTSLGISPRKAGLPHGRPSQPKYGEKLENERAVPHLGEGRVILAVKEMRSEGMSLRQIARCLSRIGIPTKRRGVAWHPEMISRLLESRHEDTFTG